MFLSDENRASPEQTEESESGGVYLNFQAKIEFSILMTIFFFYQREGGSLSNWVRAPIIFCFNMCVLPINFLPVASTSMVQIIVPPSLPRPAAQEIQDKS